MSAINGNTLGLLTSVVQLLQLMVKLQSASTQQQTPGNAFALPAGSAVDSFQASSPAQWATATNNPASTTPGGSATNNPSTSDASPTSIRAGGDMLAKAMANQGNLITRQGKAGASGTCGLSSTANMISLLKGKTVSEQEILAFAKKKGLCNDDGSTAPEQRKMVFEAYCQENGLSGKMENKYGVTLDDIINAVSSGKGAILGVHGGTLTGRGGNFSLNHAVSCVGVSRDAQGKVDGLYIIDTTQYKDGSADGVKKFSLKQVKDAMGIGRVGTVADIVS